MLDCLNTPLTLEMIIEWFKALIQRTKIGDSEIELYNREAEEELNELIKKYNSTDKLLENNLPLKYMDGESAKEYKKALQESTVDNIEPLVSYLNKQKDFIEENIKMF